MKLDNETVTSIHLATEQTSVHSVGLFTSVQLAKHSSTCDLFNPVHPCSAPAEHVLFTPGSLDRGNSQNSEQPARPKPRTRVWRADIPNAPWNAGGAS